MPTVEGLTKIAQLGNIQNQGLAQSQQMGMQNQQIMDRKNAAIQAAQLFKSGDVNGAYQLLGAVDPEMLKLSPAYQQQAAQAGSQGQTQGQYNVTTPAGANPRQLLDASMAGKEDVAKIQSGAKMNKPVVKADKNSPTGFSVVSPNGGVVPFDAYSGQPAQPKDQPIKLRPNEDIDSSGQKVMLSPAQQDAIKSTRKTFDSDTKDIVKGIDASNQALEYINKNIPGSGTLEKLRLLRGVVQGRINQQEFQAFGKGQGSLNMIDNAISEAEGKGMTPKVQDLMRQMATTAIQVQEKEYENHLQDVVQRTPEVDPLILKKRLVSESGPTGHRAIVAAISKLPPEDQAAVNWAHDNPNDPRAAAILQNLGQK